MTLREIARVRIVYQAEGQVRTVVRVCPVLTGWELSLSGDILGPGPFFILWEVGLRGQRMDKIIFPM
jgi:hypothetical protein